MPTGIHRSNLIRALEANLLVKVNEVSSQSLAFTHLAAESLGYDLPEQNITDGVRDRGIDFWFSSESGFEFFQVKSHELSDRGRIVLRQFDNRGVADLRRVVDFLKEDSGLSEASKKIRQLSKEWRMTLGKKRLAEEPKPVEAGLTLVSTCKVNR